jgi:glutathione S-transferase
MRPGRNTGARHVVSLTEIRVAQIIPNQPGKAMKLYEFAPTRSIRVRWTLQELAVDFEAIPVNMLAGENRSPTFLKINPAGKLPVLVDGDMVLTESIAIVLYLAEKYRDKGLIPTDLQQRAQLMRWLLFTTTELEQPLWRMARHTTIYPESKRLPGELALARDDFAQMANVLEDHMSGRQFVVGDTATVGDFVLAYTLDWAKMAKVLNGLPRLEAYLEEMYARPRAPMRIAAAFASIRR